MNRLIALGVVAVGGVIAFRYLPRNSRGRLVSAVKNRMGERMEKMMTGLPEGSPPKLVMSILPKLQEQNDQIITMLREQNKLLKEQRHTAGGRSAAGG